jgi:hypothetical protein
MARRGAGELPDRVETALQAAENGSLSEAEWALNGLRFEYADGYVLEKVESIRGLRRTLESPQKLNRYPGGYEGARVHLLGDLQSLRRQLARLHGAPELESSSTDLVKCSSCANLAPLRDSNAPRGLHGYCTVADQVPDPPQRDQDLDAFRRCALYVAGEPRPAPPRRRR